MTQMSNLKFKNKIKKDGACWITYPSNSSNK